MPDLPATVYLPLGAALCSTVGALALAVRVLYLDQRNDRKEALDLVRDGTAAMKESAAASNRYAEAIDRLTERLDRAA